MMKDDLCCSILGVLLVPIFPIDIEIIPKKFRRKISLAVPDLIILIGSSTLCLLSGFCHVAGDGRVPDRTARGEAASDQKCVARDILLASALTYWKTIGQESTIVVHSYWVEFYNVNHHARV